jgi:superfamily II DNA or RNA helicase
MYDLTGNLSEDNDHPDAIGIDPIHLVKRGVFDGWTEFRLRVLALEVDNQKQGSTLHSILTMNGKLLPHQLGACTKVLEQATSGALLADEVGLGKTIEAGLIMSELAARNKARRVLVLTPASLTTQWRDELRQIFGMDLKVADIESRREAMRNGHTVWDEGRVISSINIAKTGIRKDVVQGLEWDIVVVDEAHKLKDRNTQNFKLVSGLRPKVMLLLTATPIQNRLIELYNQVSLIDPRVLGQKDTFTSKFYGDRKGIRVREPEELRRRLRSVMVRNRRRDSPGLDLVKRFGQTISFALSGPETDLYDEVTSYIRQEYLSALEQRRSARGFLMVLYQRMLTSSTMAIVEALRKRVGRIKDELSGERRRREVQARFDGDISNFIDLEYSDHPGAATMYHDDMDPEKRELLRVELGELKKLLKVAEKVKVDTKAEQLRALLMRPDLKDDKVLVFTEFRATQANLARLLTQDGHKVVIFNGGMTMEEKDEAVRGFTGPVRVMISTESGGEGRNLQFCHILVNYDLPWNPMRVEQRIGRLHRIGQGHNVKIINFSTQDTIEEYVLDLLEEKIRLFEDVVGDLDLILGEVTEEDNFDAMIMKILAESRKDELSDRFRDMGRRIDEARKRMEEGSRTGAGGIVQAMDLSTYLDPDEALRDAMEDQAKVKDLVEAYLRSYGAKVWHDGPWVLEGSAPRSLMVAADLDETFKISFERVPDLERGSGVVPVAHGRPFLERVIDECSRKGLTALRRRSGIKGRGVAMFHIRLTLKGMQEHVGLHKVSVDIGTLEALGGRDDIDHDEGGDWEDVEAGFEPDGMLISSIEASYTSARRVVEDMGRRLGAELSRQNTVLCDQALERINTYYNDLEGELARKESELEDEKFEVLRKIRASKEKRSKDKYRAMVGKINKKIDGLRSRNARRREDDRRARLQEIKEVESKRALRPEIDLMAVGITLPKD